MQADERCDAVRLDQDGGGGQRRVAPITGGDCIGQRRIGLPSRGKPFGARVGWGSEQPAAEVRAEKRDRRTLHQARGQPWCWLRHPAIVVQIRDDAGEARIELDGQQQGEKVRLLGTEVEAGVQRSPRVVFRQCKHGRVGGHRQRAGVRGMEISLGSADFIGGQQAGDFRRADRRPLVRAGLASFPQIFHPQREPARQRANGGEQKGRGARHGTAATQPVVAAIPFTASSTG